VTGGASYKWNDNFSTGVYVGYQGLQAQYDGGGRLTDNAVRFGGFGTLLVDNFFLNTIVGGAYHNYQVDRSISFGSIDRTASGDPAAGEFDFALGGGYDFKAGNFVFGPTTSLQYTYLNVQGFEETGADSLNLRVDGYDTSSLLYSLGGQVAYNWKLSQKVVVTPRLTAGWQHEFLQNAYPINAAFATGGPVTPFSYQTTSPIRDYFYGGASIALGIDDTWETAFFYNAIANQDLVSHSIYFSIGAKF
jgi:outer membrane autotransporter protein